MKIKKKKFKKSCGPRATLRGSSSTQSCGALSRWVQPVQDPRPAFAGGLRLHLLKVLHYLLGKQSGRPAPLSAAESNTERSPSQTPERKGVKANTNTRFKFRLNWLENNWRVSQVRRGQPAGQRGERGARLQSQGRDRAWGTLPPCALALVFTNEAMPTLPQWLWKEPWTWLRLCGGDAGRNWRSVEVTCTKAVPRYKGEK